MVLVSALVFVHNHRVTRGYFLCTLLILSLACCIGLLQGIQFIVDLLRYLDILLT
jgi:hypothetical protein